MSDWFSHTFLANEKFPLPGSRPGFFLAPVSLPHLCLGHGRLSHGGPGPPPARCFAHRHLLAPSPWPSPKDGRTKTPVTHPVASGKHSAVMPRSRGGWAEPGEGQRVGTGTPHRAPPSRLPCSVLGEPQLGAAGEVQREQEKQQSPLCERVWAWIPSPHVTA